VTSQLMTQLQVLGCQSRRLAAPLTNDIPQELVPPVAQSQRDQWPSDNGTECLCHDTQNAECVATCAAGIRNYNIRQSTGTGLVTATCLPDTTVLGCGSASDVAGQSRYRAAVVAMRTSCRCYDDYGVTCYAVCGLFTGESSYPESFPAARLLVPTRSKSAGLNVRFDLASKTIQLLALLLIVAMRG